MLRGGGGPELVVEGGGASEIRLDERDPRRRRGVSSTIAVFSDPLSLGDLAVDGL